MSTCLCVHPKAGPTMHRWISSCSSRDTWETSCVNSCADLCVDGVVDDEAAAYRFVPNRDEDAPFLIVNVFKPERKHIHFGPMWLQ